MTSPAAPKKKGKPGRKHGNATRFRRVRQDQAIALLLTGKTQVEVAEEMGLKPDTISEWMGEPEVRAKLDKISAELIGDVRRTLIGGGVNSARALRGVVTFGARVMVDQHGNTRDAKTLTQSELAALGRAMMASTEILDRIGLGRGAKLDIRQGDRVPTQPDESMGRSEEELLFFAEHGLWPDDVEKPKEQKSA